MTKVRIATYFVLSAHLLYKEVRLQAAHEISILKSGRDSEASEAIGSNTQEREADREVQADSSVQSEVGIQNDTPSNSGEKNTVS